MKNLTAEVILIYKIVKKIGKYIKISD